MTHNQQCLDDQEKCRVEALAFVKEWPSVCKKCHGWGGKHLMGTYWEPPDFAECMECLGDGKCPRCAAVLPDDGECNCPACGWNSQAPGLPEYECWGCYDEEEE